MRSIPIRLAISIMRRNGIYMDESSYIKETITDGSIERPTTASTMPIILSIELRLRFINSPVYLLRNPSFPVSFRSVSVIALSLKRLRRIILSSSWISVSPLGIITSLPLCMAAIMIPS